MSPSTRSTSTITTIAIRRAATLWASLLLTRRHSMRPSLVFVLLAACHSDVHYVSVAAGRTSCAVTSDGHVTCWGPGAREEIAIDDAVEISGNSPHYCVRTRGGAVRCWGKV